MSRNFELLQRISDQEMFDTGTELSPLPVPNVISQPLRPERNIKQIDVQPVELEMEEKQRDEVMRFVQQVFLMPGAEAPRTVVLTGTESGNGCSWICCCAAEILASQVKGPICVVDANLRSPGLHQYFGVQNHHGLAEALRGIESIREFVRPVGRDNLWLLSCGANAINSHSLLVSDPMRLRLAELRQYFEYVLIDAPAMSTGVDAIALGRAGEGVVLVLKANSSRRETARKAVHDLQGAGARILGAVLNQRTFPIPQAIYCKL